MRDINICIYSQSVFSYLYKLVLVYLIINTYGSGVTAMNISNRKRQVIDGIWGSHGISITEEGWLPFQLDHSLIRIKFSQSLALTSPNSTTKKTVKLSQKGLNTFSVADQATGGQVRVENTKWNLLEFIWDTKVKWRLVKKYSHLSLTYYEVTQTIKQPPPSHASSILGVWISPYISSARKTNRLWQLTSGWADRVISGDIIKWYMWYYFQNTIKIPRISPRIHHCAFQTTLLHRISSPMQRSPSTWPPIQPAESHISCIFLSTRYKQRNPLWHTRKATYQNSNELQEEWLHRGPPYQGHHQIP